MRIEILSLVFSSIAIALAVAALLNAPRVTQVPDAAVEQVAAPKTVLKIPIDNYQNPTKSQELSLLEERVALLERQLAESNLDDISSNNPTEMNALKSDMFVGFDSPNDLMKVRADPEFARQRQDDFALTIVDNNLDDEQRIDAFKKLSTLGMFTENFEAVQPQHISAILDIADSTDDPTARVKAWDALTGLIHPEARGDLLTEPLLELLAQDPNPYLRRKALNGLQMDVFSSMDDENKTNTFRSALENAAAEDDDAGIRRQAQQTLQQLDQFRAMMANPKGSNIQLGSGAAIGVPFFGSNEVIIDGDAP